MKQPSGPATSARPMPAIIARVKKSSSMVMAPARSRASLPLEGRERGRGWFSLHGKNGTTPTPSPSPQGGGVLGHRVSHGDGPHDRGRDRADAHDGVRGQKPRGRLLPSP